MHPNTPRAVIVSVHYKGPDSLLALLDSLRGARELSEVAIIIVDSCSGEEYLFGIRGKIAEIPNAELLESQTNRGYFGAARFALENYLKQGRALPDWVIVCNHDVLIEDKDFLEKLFAIDRATAGVLAPRIRVLPGRVDQNPFMRQKPSWLRWASLQFIFSNYSLAKVWHWLARQKRRVKSQNWISGWNSSSNDSARPQQIYAPHGSFFIFSRRYFEAGGYLDGNLFLYGEEISVAEICRSLGVPVVYEPSLCVVHDEHRSTGKRISRFTFECQKKALQYVTSRYLSGSRKPIDSAT
ncbi:MAG TPA: glycosyltransferase [Candidatus Acidoferrum sp.]|nr:glycosyltransferase [Candidatus Acidoferrum sp.]